MSEIIRKHGLSSTGFEQELTRSIGCERRVERGDLFEVVNNDSVEEYKTIESNRFGLLVTSIPFGNHYEYVASYNDFGHNDDHEKFFRQMDFLTPELYRTLKPGRLACIHVKDRIRFGNVTGYGFPTVEPFHADTLFHFRKHGFRYCGMITVVTDVVRENAGTYRLSYSEMLKDGSKMGVGSPEYILLFRKPQTDATRGYADEPVAKSRDDYSLARWQVDAHGFWRSSGNRMVTAEDLASMNPEAILRTYQRFSIENPYDFEEHVKIGESLADRDALSKEFMSLAPASPSPDVWHDVTRMRTLNSSQSQRRLTKHICPLQFDIVDRLIKRYSNAGDEVTDPFGGLLTVPYRAIILGRRGHACELNPESFRDGLRYVKAAEVERAMPSLFDLAGINGENGREVTE
jgi:DNA modification methylase